MTTPLKLNVQTGQFSVCIGLKYSRKGTGEQ